MLLPPAKAKRSKMMLRKWKGDSCFQIWSFLASMLKFPGCCSYKLYIFVVKMAIFHTLTESNQYITNIWLQSYNGGKKRGVDDPFFGTSKTGWAFESLGTRGIVGALKPGDFWDRGRENAGTCHWDETSVIMKIPFDTPQKLWCSYWAFRGRLLGGKRQLGALHFKGTTSLPSDGKEGGS